MASCKKESVDLSGTSKTTTVYAQDINMRAIDPDAVEYYKDFAVLAEWYVDHPTVLRSEIDKNKTHSFTDSNYNDFIAELSTLAILDSNNKSISFFDMPDEMRHSFLRDYVKTEAQFVNEKLQIAQNESADDYLEARNIIFDRFANTATFSDSINFDREASKISVRNPYEEIIDDMKEIISTPTPGGVPPPGAGQSEQEFLKALSTAGILGLATVTFNPYCTNNTPNNFINKIRNEIKKGRILVALPAGFVTQQPLALNLSGGKFDVGHVAIISKDASSVPSSVSRSFSFTIGTNSEKGMHQEELGEDWIDKHGASYLMQPVRKTRTYDWKLGFIPGWKTTTEDVDNNATYNKIAGTLGRPYCSILQFLTTKWAVPERFICSSSAWWAIKEAHDIGIGDFYKPTIFPAGVFESSDMRIVGKTW